MKQELSKCCDDCRSLTIPYKCYAKGCPCHKKEELSVCCGAEKFQKNDDLGHDFWYVCSKCGKPFEPKPQEVKCAECQARISADGKCHNTINCFASAPSSPEVKECDNCDGDPKDLCPMCKKPAPSPESWEEKGLKEIAAIFKDWILAVQENKQQDEYYPTAHERIKRVLKSSREQGYREARKKYHEEYLGKMKDLMDDSFENGLFIGKDSAKKELVEKIMSHKFNTLVAETALMIGNTKLSTKDKKIVIDHKELIDFLQSLTTPKE